MLFIGVHGPNSVETMCTQGLTIRAGPFRIKLCVQRAIL